MAATSTREKIICAADLLFYQQGFSHTSFADIAKAVNISRGNFYYHFKSKDQILSAVISLRRSNTHLLLKKWELCTAQPNLRLLSFIQLLQLNQDNILRYGCPVGTLCAELIKLDHPANSDARMILTLYRTWLRRQFSALGHKTQADNLALHLLTQSQGIATLASAFNDRTYLSRQILLLQQWLDKLLNQETIPVS
ncbi:MAG: TetR/AcrR family transcriptional regulator [Oceanospirillaceae bacterium]|nr:TetR/AcrR family transcriptional regulator [Oceanospirillaceae bacterium]